MASERQHLILDFLAQSLSFSPPASLSFSISLIVSTVAKPLHHFTLHPNLCITFWFLCPLTPSLTPVFISPLFALLLSHWAWVSAFVYILPLCKLKTLCEIQRQAMAQRPHAGSKPSTQFRCIIGPGGGHRAQQTECNAPTAPLYVYPSTNRICFRGVCVLAWPEASHPRCHRYSRALPQRVLTALPCPLH